MPQSARRPGPESTLDEVHDALVEAAVAMLSETGVEIGLTHLKLSSVIAATGVSRSTAYRSLADESLPPQSVLHRDVMSRLLSRDAREANRPPVTAATLAEIEHQRENLASTDIADRTYAVRSIIRVGAGAGFEVVSNSVERSMLTAAYGALRSSAASDWRIDELRRGERRISEQFGDLYSQLAARFGYRLRPEFTSLQFATAAAAMVEGMSMRYGLSDQLGPIMRPTGREGGLEEWSLYATVFEAVFVAFFEPIDEEPFADLLRY
jgi:hypothetical protein